MIEDAKKKGYEVTCNIMAISTAQEGDIRVALDMLGKSPVDTIYIVDSFGSIYPEQLARIVNLYKEYADKYGKTLGLHAHNNQQLAFANTIEAVGDGVDWLDATYNGMGRGAGNCSMENLIGFLHNPKYNLFPVLSFVEKYIMQLKKDGVVWGYDLQYLVTGLLNQHPRTAIDFTKQNRTDYSKFYNEMTAQE
ncbi:MAG: nucleoid-structuring protein H-NS, partial [Treponema sp.]|nr:nucleoid-structuring protein H-NS [Treponema sp.]